MRKFKNAALVGSWLVVSAVQSFAVGVADADAVQAIDDAKATFDSGKSIMYTIIGVLIGVAVLKLIARKAKIGA